MLVCRFPGHSCTPQCLPPLPHKDHAAAGEFNDHVFEGLDFVLAEARRRNLFVVLTLVNYWSDYGGMPQVQQTLNMLAPLAEIEKFCCCILGAILCPLLVGHAAVSVFRRDLALPLIHDMNGDHIPPLAVCQVERGSTRCGPRGGKSRGLLHRRLGAEHLQELPRNADVPCQQLHRHRLQVRHVLLTVLLARFAFSFASPMECCWERAAAAA